MTAMKPRAKRPARNVIAALHSAHWAIMPDALENMSSIAARTNLDATTIEALEAKLGKPLNNDYRMTVRDGVATIPVCGPLFRYANLFTLISGATAYATLATDLNQALEDPTITSIILSIDSPGGETNGAAELAEMIFKARGRKPVVAYVANLGGSAAYWIAAAAREVVVAPTAIVGSVGTCLCVTDTSKRDAAEGVRRVEFVSSQSPRKRSSIDTPEGRSDIQALVDSMADVFIAAVATYRGVTTDHVLENFGQGGLFVGEDAIQPGLADALGSYESLHASLAAGERSPSAAITSRRTINSIQELHTMKTKATAESGGDNPAAPAAEESTEGSSCTRESCGHPKSAHPEGGACSTEGCSCESYQGAESEDSPPAGEPEASAPPVLSAVESAVTAERERVLGIQALSRPGKESVVAECVGDPNCSVEGAALRLLNSDKEKRSSSLAAIRGDESRIEKPGAVTPAAVEAQSTSAVVQRVLSAHQLVTSPSRS